MTYPLPNKYHDVVDDIEQLAQTITQIDTDISNLEAKTAATSEIVGDIEDTLIHTDQITNGEITNIAPNRFLIVNNDGNGFTCVDGGGTSGGKTGQCTIKRTDEDYDTIYGDIWNTSRNGTIPQMNSENGCANCLDIFCDESEIENAEQFPKVNSKTIQATQDFEVESNSSVILKNKIEQEEDVVELATNQNYGLIKVGTGINVSNGTISVDIITAADKNHLGYVKVGSGIEVEEGVISVVEIDAATKEKKGVVKVGADFELNENGEMGLKDMADASIIYKLDQIKNCENGNIDLEEQKLIYRLVIKSDLVIQINENFVPTQDYTFILELISNGLYLVSFLDQFKDGITELPINRGITKLRISKKMWVPYYEAVVSKIGAPDPTLLTPNYGDNVTSNLIVWHNGSDHDAHNLLVAGTSNLNFFGRELYFEFGTLVIVDYVYFTSAYPNEVLGEFYLKGSNDKTNWTILLYKNGEAISGKVRTELKSCFKYYKLYIDWKNSNYPRSIQLYGTELDNNESELVLLTPQMSSNITAWATLTYSNLSEGSAANITSETPSTYIHVKYSLTDTNDLTRWIKYEFTEPVVANFLDICSHGDNLDRSMRWYKLEASNDDENWELLLERQYQRNFYKYESRYHDFNNTTAYKFYRLTCLATGSTNENWKIGRFRLFQRKLGKHHFYRGVPKLSSANQDGYEVTASSQYNGNHAGYLAFDDNTQTPWATASNVGDAWLQIKLPIAMAFNAVKIAPRGDGYIDQAPSTFQIQGSNDGENWDVLDSETGISWATLGELRLFQFENATAYLYYRLYITANQGSGCHGCSCFILGNVFYEYKRLLNKYEYLVPVLSGMTTNASDGAYVVSASACDEWGKVWYPFSRSHDSFLELGSNTSGWIKIQLPEARIANVLQVGSRNGSYAGDTPRNYSLYGSNDGENWDILFSVENSNAWSSSELRRHDFENEIAYSYYRLNFSNPSLRSVCSVARWELIRHYTIQEY